MGALKMLIRQKSVLFDKLLLVMHIVFTIPENKAENMFLTLDELLLAFQIDFHHYKCFHDL